MASPALPPLPGTGSTEVSLSDLTGHIPAPDRGGEAQRITTLIQGIQTDVEALAAAYPETAEPARIALRALDAMMSQAVASRTPAEPPAPPIASG